MTDPITLIGLVASVLQLVDTATTVYDYAGDVKNAPREQRELSSEYASLKPLLEELQKRERQVDQSNPNDPRVTGMRRLEESLADCEKKMKKLAVTFESSGLKKAWKRLTWTRHKAEIKDTIVTIGRFKAILNDWLQIDLWNISRKLEQDHDSQECRKIIQWLSPLNFFVRQDDIFSKRQEGTGDWLLQCDDFNSWVSGASKTLWCHGMPGAGKTVLASIVVDHLRKQFGNETGIAAIYCNYKDFEVQTPVNLFASLWMQLVESHPISDEVKMLHKKHINRGTRPSLRKILQVLRSEIDDYSGSKVFIIVDALDECPEDNKIRGTILTELWALQSTIHLMVTSRPHVTIELDPPCLIVDIRASDKDVLHYVDGWISCDQQLARHLKGRVALQEDLQRTVVCNAQGIYVDQSV
ncbi:hypothetical protein PILCRDRAFT_828843 [Piloderma croceum F 1598]|uniref:Uncharacterized protein n=1 Tax=Piloderma croceum (strain F 1598) TaxID=765440 RepID=A0A0C3AIP9_PILCF|nr:hypothetical protein PILCRDRAFT_829950 [Piloderma croceum F 1598]KIM73703.1 hypothetical protein PILCRDRAFT_828843 [Piloderma croceum F 1598]